MVQDIKRAEIDLDFKNKPVFFLVGSTGIGKTAIAHRIADEIGLSLLSIDSMQVYRKLDIGTAKPSLSERIRYRYGGIDLVDWKDSFNAFLFVRQACHYLAKEWGNRRGVLVVGGCGLYFRAMTRGLCNAPPANLQLRTELEKMDRITLLERLTRIDPSAVSWIDCSNPRRIIRAIEVKETSGISLIEWQKKTTFPLVTPSLAFWIDRPQPEVEIRLRRRIKKMFERGWEEETLMLIEEGGMEAVEKCKAIGYKLIGQFLLQKRKNREELEEAIYRQQRGYAKRQKTWFKKEPSLCYYLLKNPEEEYRFIKSCIEKIAFFIRRNHQDFLY
ncbi:tRNA (adenosine(37)-N6)-dimethylallyltransferase MiaA [Candidatus Methylacidiphilum infernorum]|uniref:tRNA dimethylallyltransferase n=1 Tax=Candidatus Methylacidiphilum infernorum TaxID=511746 RepID=A0ABX7PT65_9BACT|nr:tRNA (adenosine(37)-N6)-dimethylallyltransferase MiaA [Candidatus Methylacidiphilum infernorum]QSR86166.1 tRNA (adenosine(37)-N6)-dimethylallyltransferase MiaA [Candidatus Methylacidiphilum infernorum]